MEIIINERVYQVMIMRKPIKHMYLRIKDDGVIHITAGRFTSDHQINQFIKLNGPKIAKLANNHHQRANKSNTFYYLGKAYELIYNDSLKDVYIEQNQIYAKNERLLNKWLNEKMTSLFNERLEICYNMFTERIPYPTLKTRTMKTRWGVCHKTNQVVTLNSLLIRYEIDIIDYVIIHELCHFIHPHHQTSFWLLVEKYCPNYKALRKVLKE